jgi:simple sugar transport system ATP-binding protein
MKGKVLKITAPIDSIKAGMGYLPDDRKLDGCIGGLSVRENILIALQARTGLFKRIPMAKQNEIADHFIKVLSIKTASRETLLSQLSGGNQQKVILARWLATNPEFLILDEPTRGIDIGTKTEIQKLVLQLAGKGMSVIFISSEIDEMLRTCSRICIMRDGQKVGELDSKETELNQETVMAAIAGGES